MWTQTCSPPLAAARRIYLAAPDGRLRTPRVLAAWPAGAPARVGLLAAQTLAATHANRGRTAHLPRGARSRHLTKRHRVAGDSVMVAAVRRAYVRMSSPRLLHGRSRGHWQRSSAGCAGRLAGGAGCAAAGGGNESGRGPGQAHDALTADQATKKLQLQGLWEYGGQGEAHLERLYPGMS